MRSGSTATVGMIGGGQLSRMTQQAAISLGVDLHVLAFHDDEPAIRAGATMHEGSHLDAEAVSALAAATTVITLDHEQTPTETLAALVDAGHAVHPRPSASEYAKDKAFARCQFAAWGLPIPAFEVIDANADAANAFGDNHGWPIVLKAPTGGYDGRGVAFIDSADALATDTLAQNTPTWLLEAAVPIAMEIAVLVARRPSGDSVTYPVVETVQEAGMCRELVLPARIDTDLAEAAAALAVDIADRIDVTGIMAVELFVTHDGQLLINELATRPHNSGHITMEACRTSQFENHLRAVLDWPLGSTQLVAPAAATVNVVGIDESDSFAATLPLALEDPTVHVHLYEKGSRPERKLGHVTALADDVDAALTSAHGAVDRLVGR